MVQLLLPEVWELGQARLDLPSPGNEQSGPDGCFDIPFEWLEKGYYYEYDDGGEEPEPCWVSAWRRDFYPICVRMASQSYVFPNRRAWQCTKFQTADKYDSPENCFRPEIVSYHPRYLFSDACIAWWRGWMKSGGGARPDLDPYSACNTTQGSIGYQRWNSESQEMICEIWREFECAVCPGINSQEVQPLPGVPLPPSPSTTRQKAWDSCYAGCVSDGWSPLCSTMSLNNTNPWRSYANECVMRCDQQFSPLPPVGVARNITAWSLWDGCDQALLAQIKDRGDALVAQRCYDCPAGFYWVETSFSSPARAVAFTILTVIMLLLRA